MDGDEGCDWKGSVASTNGFRVSTRTPPRIASLDGLRAGAISLVVLCHMRDQIGVSLPPLVDRLVVKFWGTLGVDLFFGLSGFLITTLLRQEYERTGRIDLGNFYFRRAFRILPALFCFLAVIVVLNLTQVLSVPWFSVLAGTFFFQNYNFRYTSFGDSRFVVHLWSLSAEEQFYLLWPLAYAWLGTRRAARWALVLALAAPLVRVGCYFLFPTLRGEIFEMFHTTYDCFLWGGLLAIWWEGRAIRAVLDRLRSPFWFIFVAGFYLVGGPILETIGRGIYGLPIGLSLRFLCVAFLIAWAVTYRDSGPGRLLNWPLLRAVGVASYSVYLWQELFLGVGQHTFSPSWEVALAATACTATLSYFGVERPFLALRARLGRAPAPREATERLDRPALPSEL